MISRLAYHHNLVILDLESVPIDGAETYLAEVKAPGHYKDPQKIADFIEEGTAKRKAQMALDLDLARIVALGYIRVPTPAPQLAPVPNVLLCGTLAEEATTLRVLRETLENGTLVTFCGSAFDVPLLSRRYRYLNLAPLQVELDRYKSPQIDLYEILTLRGRTSAHPLAWYDKRLGHVYPDTIAGGDVETAIKAGEWGKVAEHCAADVQRVYNLASFLGVLPNE
jgi:Predicted 3'-5' exonuclease related to the exonuclease domain of PolB